MEEHAAHLEREVRERTAELERRNHRVEQVRYRFTDLAFVA